MSVSKPLAPPEGAPSNSGASMTAALEAAIRTKLALETAPWGTAPAGAGLPGGTHLWGVPAVDSKQIARCSPIFERLLGVKLDISLIKPGGYSSIDAAVKDIVPKMINHATTKKGA